MTNTYLRPRAGALLISRTHGTLHEVVGMRYAPYQVEFTPIRVMFDDVFIKTDAPCRYTSRFSRESWTYACWNCFEPLDVHARGQCPFASTHFLVRPRKNT